MKNRAFTEHLSDHQLLEISALWKQLLTGLSRKHATKQRTLPDNNSVFRCKLRFMKHGDSH